MGKISKLSVSFLICGLLTLFPLETSAQAVLNFGSTGEEVLLLQSKLRDYGYYSGIPDGEFGSDTLTSVVNFQLDGGLEPDGIVGDKTFQLIMNYRSSGTLASRALSENRKGQYIVSLAKRFLGVPYVWSGKSPSGFDCSGFTYYIFNQTGIDLPRMADRQFEIGRPVSLAELALGDLVFFSTYESGPSHVGIYIGNGYFIHASSGADEVTVTPLSKPYYRERYLGARRVI